MQKLSRFLVVAAAIATFAFGVTVSANAAESESSAASGHEGFFFNVDVGPAWVQYKVTGPQGTLKTSTSGAILSFRFGGAITPHLVLSGNIQANSTINRPQLTFNGNNIYPAGDYHFASATYGVGLTWYSDSNTFVGFTLGMSKASLVTDYYDVDSDWGYGVGVRIGHEWWVGDDWALGVVGSVRYMQADADTARGSALLTEAMVSTSIKSRP